MFNEANLTWNLSLLLPSADEAVIAKDRQEVREAVEAFVAKWRDRSDYLTDTKVLKEALDDYEALQSNFGTDGKSGYYIWLQENQDQLSAAIKAKLQQAVEFATKLQNQLQFFELNIGKIDESSQATILADPALADYKHFLERTFTTAKYQLSEAEERIMNLKSTSSYSKWVQLTEKALSSQERQVKGASSELHAEPLEGLMTLISHNDKPIRDEASIALNDILLGAREVAEAEINAILADHKVDNEVRGFIRPDQSRHVADDIETETVEAMLEAVSGRNELAHRFYQLKADLLGLPKLAYHERNLEFGEVNQEYLWDDGAKIVDEVYTELDPRFGEIFRMFRDNGQIDVYPRKGKSGGAFCVHFLKSQPTYLLLNYTNKLKDVTTLGHELGHGLNNEFMKKARNSLSFGTTLATAEVASQYLEDFVLDRLVSEADDETKLAINMSRLNDSVSSIFRQVACYRFEQAIHAQFAEKGYLSADDIGELFRVAMSAYMGPAVEQSSGSENWWIYWSHIRRFFYVYSYASGLLIAKAMQTATRADKQFIDKVVQFLAAGRSAAPKDIFSDMGIDITDVQFWQSGLDEMERLLYETTEMAKKLGKLPV